MVFIIVYALIMKCPYCGNTSQVTNSRARAKETQTWRRRACLACKQVWTTLEVIDLSSSHRVSDMEGHLQPFSRDKLFISIKDSLQHRKSALQDATALTDTVLYQLLRRNQADIPVSSILKLTHTALKRFDPTAGAVYAARHEL